MAPRHTERYIAFSYAVESKKGAYIALQWGFLSALSTGASLIAFGINYHADVAECPTAVYVVFLVLMASSTLVCFFFIVPPSTVRRSDGTALAHFPYEGFLVELKAQVELFKDWRMLALLVPMFASEVAVIVFSTLNAMYFNIRTRSLNSVFFTLMQAVGALVITVLLDSEKIGGRRTRGMVSTAVMGAVILAGWAGTTAWLYNHPYDAANPPLWDWSDSEFGGFFVLNLIFGANMCIYQVVVQWIIASFTNNPQRLARYAGCAKGCLAGGLAASFGVEAAGLSQLNVVAFNFSMQAVGLVCMFAVCWTSVTPTNYFLEEGVIPPVAVQVEKGVTVTDAVEEPTEAPKGGESTEVKEV